MYHVYNATELLHMEILVNFGSLSTEYANEITIVDISDCLVLA